MSLVNTVNLSISSPGTAAAVGGAVLLIVAIVFVVSRMVKSPLASKMVYGDIVSGTGGRVVVKANALPELQNGAEFGYSFWLYLEPSGGSAKDRLVFAHPVDGSGVRVLLDKDTNRLRFSVTGAEGAGSPAINYVPMSRWVHVVAVFANGVLTYFVDGEVASVHTLKVPMNFAGPGGAMTISGGAGASAGTYEGFQGYVGYVSFLNYYPAPSLVKAMYNKGPTPEQGLLSWLGLRGYGVRSPVYKINNEAPKNNVAKL